MHDEMRHPSAPGTPGASYPPRPSARPPAALYVALSLLLLGGLLTFVDWYVDRRFLADMFRGSDDMAEILPKFSIARLVASAVGVVAALGLLVATFRGVNWARTLLAVACFGYALANIGAALSAAFLLVAGRGAFNEGGDTTSTHVSVLNGLSLAVDVILFLMVMVCALILLTGRTKAFTKAPSR
ncbi:hypothetical protein GCM10010199_16800 [Dactylosporangium roseum]